MLNDKNCIRYIKKGQQEGLEYVIRTYGGAVKSVVAKILHNFHEDIQECVDDVYMEVWNNIQYFDEKKGNLKNWILAIAKYRAINYLNKLSRRYSETNLELLENKIEASIYLDETETQVQELLEELLDGLSDKDKEIVRKRYIEEQSIDELAAEYNVTASTIYSRLSRSRKKMLIRRKSEV